ncbi:Anti-sigma regulatory factor (Ser/Thr protein kinase) [Streptomyces sp. 3213]|uniref:ATP-binding protein n=1 Tax=Streptomyces sp. 3213.3 TaxID=1855348 RepID=UPI00089585BE|nr:ATP-binding protein [Streptomyces sp. 3213.3]SED18664.1 Anti-sigma regulatory factor (Ser/Thr protein kinase) [Streptomyces sp. 3213] [Streptomyces sp. 3213.3]
MIVSAQPRPIGHPGYSETLPALEESADAARKLVRTALAAWHLDELTDSGILLVTELVANAIKHTDTRSIRVVVSRPSERFVRIGVVDRARALPQMVKPHDDLLTNGRGLLLIDALAERWGTDIYRWGKQVWAELLSEPTE